MPILWNEDLSVGVAEIDNQHKDYTNETTEIRVNFIGKVWFLKLVGINYHLWNRSVCSLD